MTSLNIGFNKERAKAENARWRSNPSIAAKPRPFLLLAAVLGITIACVGLLYSAVSSLKLRLFTGVYRDDMSGKRTVGYFVGHQMIWWIADDANHPRSTGMIINCLLALLTRSKGNLRPQVSSSADSPPTPHPYQLRLCECQPRVRRGRAQRYLGGHRSESIRCRIKADEVRKDSLRR